MEGITSNSSLNQTTQCIMIIKENAKDHQPLNLVLRLLKKLRYFTGPTHFVPVVAPASPGQASFTLAL